MYQLARLYESFLRGGLLAPATVAAIA